MKKIFTLICLIYLIPTLVRSQFEPGQKVIGGNIGFSTFKDESLYNNFLTTNYSNVSINPSISTFKKPNVLRGVGLSYAYSYRKEESSNLPQTSTTTNNSIGIDLFSQRFFLLTSNLFFTVRTSGSILYFSGKQRTSINSTRLETKNNGFGLGVNLAPGITYKLTQRLLFDAYLTNLLSVNYTHTKARHNNTTATSERKGKSNSFSLSSSLSNTSLGNVGLGFRWLLKKR
jgi:hypothetical protein